MSTHNLDLESHAYFTEVRPENLGKTLSCRVQDLQNIPQLDQKSGIGPDEVDRAGLEQLLAQGKHTGF